MENFACPYDKSELNKEQGQLIIIADAKERAVPSMKRENNPNAYLKVVILINKRWKKIKLRAEILVNVIIDV